MAKARDDAQRRERRRFRWRVLRNTVAFSAVAAGVGWSLAFHNSYGSWPFLDVGDRISWCGQDYEKSVSDLTIAEVNANKPRPVEQLFRYPPRLPQQNVLGVRVEPGCADRLYVRTDADRYTEYLAASARP